MAYCKCHTCPKQGRFEEGKYYDWYYGVEKTSLPPNKRSRNIRDNDGNHHVFSGKEYLLYFKDMVSDSTKMSIYIDRKNALLFAPEFDRITGFSSPLSYYEQLPTPYTEADVGQTFKKVWEEYKDHPPITDQAAKEATPYFTIVTKGKGWKAFASSRYMIWVEFFSSEQEIRLTYWPKRNGGFELHTPDRHVGRLLPMSASCEEIGHAVLSIFEEAGIIDHLEQLLQK